MAERGGWPDSTQARTLAFETAKQLTTLNAGSIVLIGAFLKDIFPSENGTLAVSAGMKLLIALSFLSFGASLVGSTFAMIYYTRVAAPLAQLRGTRASWFVRLFVVRLPLPAFTAGVICFGSAVVINLVGAPIGGCG
jgi:hypothetical protein